MWDLSGAIAGGTTGIGPVVTVAPVTIMLSEIHFATPAHGNPHWHYLYESVSSHHDAPGDLQGWARGDKIVLPEWADNGRRNLNSCWTRNAPVSVRIKLICATSSAVGASLTCTPVLNGHTTPLTPVTVHFVYPANTMETWVDVPLGGNLPDEIGRHDLELRWSVAGGRLRFLGPPITRHRIYAIYGQPFDPEYDSGDVHDTGQPTTREQGTLTGTRKRFDHMMSLLDSSHRLPVATRDDLVEVFWKLHVGINDRDPPYFEGLNDQHITTGPANFGQQLSLEDSWLAFCRTPDIVVRARQTPLNGRPRPDRDVIFHWNDASCIGLAQVAKTMLAAVGLFARRAWVLPKTTRMPDGITVPVAETDLYMLGEPVAGREQVRSFHYNGHLMHAHPRLLEPGDNWEYFEGCLLTPTGKFLTGGYSSSSIPRGGFNSARELLNWWCHTHRPDFGQRFMAWVCDWEGTDGDALDLPTHHYWDVDGNHYDASNYVQIRNRGKELPPP